MPTHKVKGGYKWGKHGKIYPTKAQADKQGRAIYANGWRETNENKLIKISNKDIENMVKETIENILKILI